LKLRPASSRSFIALTAKIMDRPSHPTEPPFVDTAPSDSQLTDYDRAHLRTYLRLLDAAAEGADWEEAARIVLGIDPLAEPDRARRVYETHFARALWLSQHGYREFLKSPR
jgi:T6SS, Transcription factor, DNA binding domain